MMNAMKKPIIALLSLLLAASAFAAEPKEPEVLLKGAGFSFPAAGGPAAKLAWLGGGSAVLTGGRGSLLLGDTTAIGFGVYSLSSEVFTQDASGLKRELGLTYGGLVLDTFFLPRRPLFLNFSTLVGGGGATGTRRTATAEKDRTSFFIVEPEINIMLNVTRELRVGLGLSYRLTAGSDTASVLGETLNGPAGALSILYGK
jgi:hypothetical protein